MSALRKPAGKRRSHAVVRDGGIVRVKECKSCGEDKVVADDPRVSEFRLRRRVNGDGRERFDWDATCKRCAHENRPRPEDREFIERLGWSYVQSGRLVAPAGPFACWLRTYGRRKRIFNECVYRPVGRADEVDGAALAFHLGVEARRVTAVLAGGQANVSVDIVDRAIVNCDLPGLEVRLPDRVVDVWDVVDLYGGGAR